MTASAFPHLLAPLALGNITLANRMIMGAMHTRIETLDHAAARIRAFFRARAEGEIGLIITGGVAPNMEGRMEDDAPALCGDIDLDWHRAIVDAVAGTQTKVCLQILHAGRYAKFDGCVGPGARRARINRHAPRALSTAEVWRTIDDFATAAARARELGYHAVEIMGSEGYLINEFTAPATNDRADEFGGDIDGRARLPVEILKAVRRKAGADFAVIYRISAVDLVEGGMVGAETLDLARRLQAAGADILNTGIGWHESDVPTIAHNVPRAAWAYAAARIKQVVSIPVVASNRINDPGVAEALLAEGRADLISMARPLLADADFARKVRLGRPDRINTCIACNQACLDHIFQRRSASCLVNPRAGREYDWNDRPATSPKRLAVVGAGAAGISFSIDAARRGHRVTLFEAAPEIGGQLLLARNVPGKTEFDEMLRYFRVSLAAAEVDLRLGSAATARAVAGGGYDAVVLASGVRPRLLDLPGADRANVLRYDDALRGAPIGQRVVIVGAGAIAFDMIEYLLGAAPHHPPELADFAVEYGLDLSAGSAGGRAPRPDHLAARRTVTLLQRSDRRPGSTLALTTGWIRRDKAQRYGVEILTGTVPVRIDDAGVHVRGATGTDKVLPADTVILCVGQESVRDLESDLRSLAPALPVHVIGGADVAAELDAKRAIDQACRLAAAI